MENTKKATAPRGVRKDDIWAELQKVDQQVSVRLPLGMVEAMKKIAHERSVPLRAIYTEAVENYLSETKK